jgi:hypothetical protein
VPPVNVVVDDEVVAALGATQKGACVFERHDASRRESEVAFCEARHRWVDLDHVRGVDGLRKARVSERSRLAA